MTLIRALGALLVAGGVLLATGCCPPSKVAPFVAVRERQLRSDELSLPLDEPGRAHLVSFLEAGGSRRVMASGTDPVYPDARERYLPLLELLSAEPNLEAKDLTDGTFKQWFSGEPNDQVIDASKEEPPLFDRRLALSDGRFWFVFTLGGGNSRLASLVVFPATREPVEEQQP